MQITVLGARVSECFAFLTFLLFKATTQTVFQVKNAFVRGLYRKHIIGAWLQSQRSMHGEKQTSDRCDLDLELFPFHCCNHRINQISIIYVGNY